MNADTWARIKPIVAEASELPADQREAFVTRQCADPELRRQVLEVLGSPAALSAAMAAGALRSGSSLGPYVVEELIGRGGMGEVYRARDSRLDREVAVKVLPPVFALHPDRLERFAREAKLLGALNHPHICTLYDVGTEQGTNYLVMEYVDGELLADHVARGPLPLRDVLTYGMQIADALAKAHARGIVHRDLKPGNVMLTKSGAKLLDFGLARIDPDPSGAVPLPTETADGAIVGTWQYMAPEQVEARKADARTDMWALGCLLYEMVTGRPAVEGKTQGSLIAAILKGEPSRPPANVSVPALLDHVVRRCLTKEPDNRWQSSADVRFELAWIAESSDPREGPNLPPTPAQSRAAWVGWATAAALTVVVVALAGTSRWRATDPGPAAVHLSVNVPVEAGAVRFMTQSPDGRKLAFVGYHSGSTNDSVWVHEFDSIQSHPLAGTAGARQMPFWSPDSRSIGFFADGKLKRFDLQTGAVQVICNAPAGHGGAWNRDGIILFASSAYSSLYRVSETGGAAQTVTVLNAAAGDQSHHDPAFADDGDHFVFTALRADGHSEIRAGSLSRRATTTLIDLSVGFNSPAEPSQALLAGGHLVYARGGALYAQRVDVAQQRLTGEPSVIAPHVDEDDSGRYAFTATRDLLVYREVSPEARARQLISLLRDGSAPRPVWTPGWNTEAVISPDGRRLAIARADDRDTTSNIWIVDVDRGTATRLTDEGYVDSPRWSPDGTRVFYSVWTGLAVSSIFAKRVDGTEPAELIVDAPAVVKYPQAWLADGRLLFEVATGSSLDLWSLNLSTHARAPVIQGRRGAHGFESSPDGRLISYASVSEAVSNVYLEPLGEATRVQVSESGGDFPHWRSDAKELFYVANGTLMAAALRGDGTPQVIATRTLFPLPDAPRDYAPAPDGQRFYVWTRADPTKKPEIIASVNWMSALKQP
jgi:serine/threonine protein kinase